jgi:signal transduction histidine kinase
MERKDKYACIAVKDTGIGIPEEHIKHIFERFYRVDKSQSRSEGTAGLGLAISWRIAEIHNGTITVESEVGKGSTFTVYLPLTG